MRTAIILQRVERGVEIQKQLPRKGVALLGAIEFD